jgi:hypothetical protein
MRLRRRDVLERVQRRGFVEHSESRQIKAGVDKEIRGGIAHHGHQADVHDLRREVAHDMHADQLQIVLTKEQLQKAVQVADDPATGIFPIVRPSHEVWNFSISPYTGRRPLSSRRKMRCNRVEISLVTSKRFIRFPEPVGHSTLKLSP